ncbi:MAG: MFS transporter [Dehalococcoidia bacterium]
MLWRAVVRQPMKWLPAFLLGLTTIGTYGTAYYSIGVLIPAIHDETGWSTGALSGGFSLAVLGQGGVALLAGRIFDRRGAFIVFVTAIVLGSAFLLLASLASRPWHFTAAWALGGATIGGGLYYNMTMPAIARLYPLDRATGLSVLTLLGALASPIFYPIAGWMIDQWGWRTALQVLVGLMACCVAPTLLVVRAPAAASLPEHASKAPLRDALASSDVRRLLLVLALGGVAGSSFVLNQVPAMEAAGLSLTAAASYAGVRGLFQIPGRLLLTPLTRRFGVRGTIALCYGVAATAALALVAAIQGASTQLMAGYFCVLGGMSLGLLSPLNGLFQAEVFGDEHLGTLSGLAVVVGSLAGAAGGFVSGVLVDLAGGFVAALLLAAGCYILAIIGLSWRSVPMTGAQPSEETVAAG